MPPGGLSSDEQAILTSWAEGGTPEECEGGGGDADADSDIDTSHDADPSGTMYCGDVQSLLEVSCTSCHSSALTGAARFGATPGVDYDTYEAAVVNSARGNVRIQNRTMPPGAGFSAAERAMFQSWIDNGTPECAGSDGGTDGGVTCSTGNYWSRGEGSTMQPGVACSSCHGSREDALAVGGTVMGALHDEDLCYGISGVQVAITGSDGLVRNFTSNSTGNIAAELEHGGRIATPYTVVMHYEGRDRAMVSAQSNISCNACHTMAGTEGAPGRVVAP
jgi:hypothetical protein